MTTSTQNTSTIGYYMISRPTRAKCQIPPDLVVDSWASSVESRSTLDFLYVPDV